MDLIIQRLNGEEHLFSDYGKVLNFTVESPSYETTSEMIDGRHGAIDLETIYGPRKMNGSFYLFSENNAQFPLMRNKIFAIFDSKEPFYLVDTRESHKRWLVKCDGGFSIEQILYNRGRFDAGFIAFSPFAESLGTTLYPHEDDKLQQIEDDTRRPIQYIFNTSNLWVFNAGDVAVDPRSMFLEVVYKGASTNLAILNKTTNEAWSYTGTTASDDELQLMGVQSKKNGVSVFKDTNKKLITLEKGWNELQLSGTSGSFTLSIDFRFRYI